MMIVIYLLSFWGTFFAAEHNNFAAVMAFNSTIVNAVDNQLVVPKDLLKCSETLRHMCADPEEVIRCDGLCRQQIKNIFPEDAEFVENYFIKYANDIQKNDRILLQSKLSKLPTDKLTECLIVADFLEVPNLLDVAVQEAQERITREQLCGNLKGLKEIIRHFERVPPIVEALIAQKMSVASLRFLVAHSDIVKKWTWRNASTAELLFFRQNGDFLSLHRNGAVKLFNASKNEIVEKNDVPIDKQVIFLAIKPDGSEYATVTLNNKIAAWESTTGKLLMELQDAYTVSAITYNYMTHGIAIGYLDLRGNVRLCNFNCPEKDSKFLYHDSLLQPGNGHVRSLAFSRDDKLLAIGYMDAIHFWRACEGDYVKMKELRGYNSIINTLAFHPNNNDLFVGDGNGLIKLWHIDTNEAVGVMFDDYSVKAIVISSDGKKLAYNTHDMRNKHIHMMDIAIFDEPNIGKVNSLRQAALVKNVCMAPVYNICKQCRSSVEALFLLEGLPVRVRERLEKFVTFNACRQHAQQQCP